MENLNAEQIKKALECHAGYFSCDECPYDPYEETGERYCGCVLAKHALALITSQEQRIKELTEENERLRGILLQFTDIVHKWGNKNGYDTSEISLVPILNEANAIKTQIEADTVRKMQERLKMYFGTYILGYKIPLSEVLKVINQIAKEMLEGVCENTIN